MMVLREMIHLLIADRIDKFNGHREKAARSLEISSRTLRNYMNRKKEDDVKVLGDIDPIPGVPTNEERLKHLNHILNRVRKSSTHKEN